MTPHDPTPALAPARVERYVIRNAATGETGDTYRLAMNATYNVPYWERVWRMRVVEVVRCVELRPGDVFLPSEAREGAVASLARALHDFGKVLEWHERGPAVHRHFEDMARNALAALGAALPAAEGEG